MELEWLKILGLFIKGFVVKIETLNKMDQKQVP